MEKVPQFLRQVPAWGFLLALGVLAVAVHALLGLPARALLPEYINGDAYDYHLAALNLYRHGFQPHPTRMFGFPLLTGWIVLIDPAFETYARFCYGFNALCWLGSGWLLLRIGRQWLNNSLALLPALLFGLNVGGIVLISQAVTETLYVFLLLLTLWLWLGYRRTGRAGWVMAAFAVFCYSTVVRPTATLWLLAIIPALLFHFKSRPFLLKKIAVGLAFSLLATLGLQIGLMKNRYDLFVTSNIGLLTYYQYIDAYAAAETPGVSWSQRAADWEAERDRRKASIGLGQESWNDVLRIADWPSVRARMEAQAADTWSAHKGALLQSYLRNGVSNSLGGSMIAEFLANRSAEPGIAGAARWIARLSRLQNGVCSLLTLLFAFSALYRWGIRRQLPGGTDLLAWFGTSIMLLSAVSFAQGDRFHLVFMPFTALVAAWKWPTRKREKSGRI